MITNPIATTTAAARMLRKMISEGFIVAFFGCSAVFGRFGRNSW
jgi:hypothetical protein